MNRCSKCGGNLLPRVDPDTGLAMHCVQCGRPARRDAAPAFILAEQSRQAGKEQHPSMVGQLTECPICARHLYEKGLGSHMAQMHQTTQARA